MKTFCYCVLVSFLLPVAFGLAADSSFDQVDQKLKAEYQQAKIDQQQQFRRLAAEKKDLQQQLDEREKAIAGLKKENNFLESSLEAYAEQEKKLEIRQQAVIAEMNELDGTVRIGIRDLKAILERSLVSGMHPGRLRPFDEMLSQKGLPSMTGIRQLVENSFAEIKAGADIVTKHGKFVALDGRMTSGDIFCLGALTAIYRQDDNREIGYAVYGKENDALLAVSRAPWLIGRCLEKYLEGSSNEVYLDFSGGATVRQLALRPTAWERLRSGGVLVWPILLIGLIAFLVSLERFFFLRRVKSNTDTVMVEVIGLLASGRWQACLELLENKRGPVYNVLAAGLKFRQASREVLENVLEEAIMKELPRLEKYLPTLQVLAAVAPLLGLLGTVTGMINTFQVITIFGTGDPKLMSGGISEALVTTMLGLMVAIPIILLHAYFSRKVDSVIGDMEEKAVGLTVALVNKELSEES